MCESVSVDGRVAAVVEAVDACATLPLWHLTSVECIETLDAVVAAERRLVGLKLRLVQRLDAAGVAKEQGATSTVVWLRDRYRIAVGTARRLVDAARAVVVGPPVLRNAVVRGELHQEQVEVITGTLARIPLVDRPEAARRLVDEAGVWDARVLARMGALIIAAVATDAEDADGIEALEQAEQRARRARYLTIRPGRDGVGYRVDGRLTTEQAAVVTAALDPLCKPLADDDRSPGQRRADALEEVCRLALGTTDLPDNGGDRPQIVVTTAYDTLTQQLGAGILDTGERLSPAAVRILCCDAMLLPAVLGTAGQLLDLGRERRLFTGPIRRALVLRDGGCAFPACDRPPRWCAGHHVVGWHQGGATCLANAVLLCGFHHRAIHQPGGWTVYIAPDGLPTFIPPPRIDPHQRPQRNRYHRRE
jgi:hypothetical protein